MKTTRNDLYRSEIDGLRAIAVALVIGHHFSREVLPSGYIGVDLFFVISGFVITASLVNRPYVGLTDFLIGFYGRRMRRLLPALISFVLLASLATLFVDPRPHESLWTGFSALFGISNVFLWADRIDYFSRSTDLNTFTHTWSLGVEEQFYVIFPILIFQLYFKKNSKTTFLIFMSALTFVSYAFFLLTSEMFPAASYYLLPARFWEIGVGGLICFIGQQSPSRSKWIDCLLWLAFALVLICAFLPRSLSVATTTLTVFAAAFLIAAGQKGSTLSRALSWNPVVFIGLMSYPLYLWHWPVLSLSRWTVGVTAFTAPLQVLTMAGLAWATYRYIETPIRSGNFFSKPSHSVLTGAIGIVCASILIVSMNNFEGALQRLTRNQTLPPAWFPLRGSSLPYNPTCVVDGVTRLLTPTTVDNCTVAPTKDGAPTFWAMGDSHAGHLQGMLYALHDRLGVGVHLIETPGKPFPFGTSSPFQPRLDIFKTAEERFRKGDVLLLARAYILNNHLPADGLLEWAQQVVALADRLKDKGISVVVVGPPPLFNFAAVEACVNRFWNRDCAVDYETASSEVAAVLSIIRPVLDGHPNVLLFEPFPFLCPPAARCSPFINGTIGFKDRDHLNVVGSTALAEPFAAFAISHHLYHVSLTRTQVPACVIRLT